MRIFRFILILSVLLLALGLWVAGKQLQPGELQRLQENPGADTPTTEAQAPTATNTNEPGADSPTANSTPEPTGVDTLAPNVLSIEIAPATVDTTASSQVLTVTAHITDDLSGLQSLILHFAPVNGGTQSIEFQIFGSQRVSGDRRDGIYLASAILPKYSAHGRWYLNGLMVNDNANNRAEQYRFDEGEAPPPDITPPDIAPLGSEPAAAFSYIVEELPYFINGEDSGPPVITEPDPVDPEPTKPDPSEPDPLKPGDESPSGHEIFMPSVSD